MTKCVFLLLVVTASACAPSADPPPAAEVPVQPLVIGSSAPAPIAVAPAEPARDEPVAATSSPLAVPARDPRLALATRSRALIVTEVQQLELLLAGTAVTAPEHGLIAGRIGHGYSELARVSDGAVAATARKNALRSYEIVINDSPQDPHIDEAYYYAGLEYELAGNLQQARRSYFEVIKRSPQSRLIPLAYFAFGEMFLAESANDPSKLDLAEQAYREVLKYPAARNAVFGEAKQRMSEVAARKRP